jgi:hypothetical protein
MVANAFMESQTKNATVTTVAMIKVARTRIAPQLQTSCSPQLHFCRDFTFKAINYSKAATLYGNGSRSDSAANSPEIF